DVLGNSAKGSATVELDTQPPTISASRSPGPNSNGWNNTAVTVSFSCGDQGPSGIKSCPSASTLSGDGANQSVTGVAVDNAGNQTNATSPGVNIDSTSPKTTVTAPAGWTNQSVTVSFSATDNLSGVKATWYSLDGAAAQSGSSLTISTEGVHSLAFWSEDFAGNVESARN